MSSLNFCDLRSDTVTKPTEEMYQAMRQAELGDDVLGDDPTVKQLEELAAKIVNKEAALFFPSGTMANTAALLAHNCRLQEVIVEEHSHIMNYENGNISNLAGAVARSLPSNFGEIPLELLKKNIKPTGDDHQLKTAGICLENTHNYYSGAVLTIDYLKRVYDLCRNNNLFLHIDGARIFNASLALKLSVREITEHCSSIMFCLSKGLSAPVGSMLAGDRNFISRAFKFRKILGGGMRQSGLLASCGIVALQSMIDRLDDDHQKARFLAEKISRIPHLKLQTPPLITNIVIFEVGEDLITAEELQKRLEKLNILCFTFGPGRIRFVTHKDQSWQQIEYAAESLRKVMNSL